MGGGCFSSADSSR